MVALLCSHIAIIVSQTLVGHDFVVGSIPVTGRSDSTALVFGCLCPIFRTPLLNRWPLGSKNTLVGSYFENKPKSHFHKPKTAITKIWQLSSHGKNSVLAGAMPPVMVELSMPQVLVITSYPWHGGKSGYKQTPLPILFINHDQMLWEYPLKIRGFYPASSLCMFGYLTALQCLYRDKCAISFSKEYHSLTAVTRVNMQPDMQTPSKQFGQSTTIRCGISSLTRSKTAGWWIYHMLIQHLILSFNPCWLSNRLIIPIFVHLSWIET